MPRGWGRIFVVLTVAAILAWGPLAPAVQAGGISYQVISSVFLDKIDNSQDGTTLKPPEGAKVLKVRMKMEKTTADPILISNLDFTVHYLLETSMLGSPLRLPMVRPCEGLRWQGMQANEYGQWLLVSEELKKRGESLIITQASPGVYFLDLAFWVHQGVGDIQVYAATPQGLANPK